MLLTMALAGAALQRPCKLLQATTCFTCACSQQQQNSVPWATGCCGLTLVNHLVAGVRVKPLDTIAVEVAGAQALEVQVVGPGVCTRPRNVKL